MLTRISRRRLWLAAAAAVLVVVSLVPPVGIYARRYVFAESLQFAVFAVVVPALLALGAPWRVLRLTALMHARVGRAATRPLGAFRSARVGRAATRPLSAFWSARVGRAATRPLSGRSTFLRGAAVLVVFLGAVIAWRLPPTVNALATDPGLAVLELATLSCPGTMLWLELVESPPLLPRLARPVRAVFAAVAMWTIWVLAYILGFSQAVWFRAYAHPGLGSVADQEIATGLLWAVSAVCLIPVVYVTALTWLRDSEDPDQGLRQVSQAQEPQSGPGRWPRPPRGWNAHSA